ncbi:MAG TPA: DUF1674 domain-containing protein [Wenzhouxiangellaceae bacterium]|nr:DUF1674 domain-containing protein [Wenzhouxiangellaceae bacterium]
MAGSAENQGSGQDDLRRKDPESPCGSDAKHVENSKDEAAQPREIGGRKGPDPVRYGDWEKNGRCIDF